MPRRELFDGGEFPHVQFRAGPAPQQCPQLVISVEAHAMIDPEYPPSAAKNVATLAISIVDQDVEDGEQPQLSNIGVDHRHRAIVRIKAFHGSEPTLLGHGRAWNKINELVGCRLVDLYPNLKGPGAERSIGQHGDRYTVETADP